jgi:hypothetical protein
LMLEAQGTTYFKSSSTMLSYFIKKECIVRII